MSLMFRESPFVTTRAYSLAFDDEFLWWKELNWLHSEHVRHVQEIMHQNPFVTCIVYRTGKVPQEALDHFKKYIRTNALNGGVTFSDTIVTGVHFAYSELYQQFTGDVRRISFSKFMDCVKLFTSEKLDYNIMNWTQVTLHN